MTFSPDGATLASASADQNIVLYDVAAQKIRSRFLGHQGEVWALEFSPDGKWLVSGSTYDHTLKLWDAKHSRTDDTIADAKVPLAFTKDGRFFFYGNDGGLQKYDLTLRRSTTLPLPVKEKKFYEWWDVNFSSDASKVAFYNLDSNKEVWNLETMRRMMVITNQTKQGRICLAFSEDGTRVATKEQPAEVRLWDTASRQLLQTLPAFPGDNYELGFSPRGKLLAVVGEDHGAVFDLERKKELFRCGVKGRTILALAFSHDGKWLATGSNDNLIYIWDLQSASATGVLRGHMSGVVGLAFSPDNRTLASCGDRRVKLWSMETLQEMLTLHYDGVGEVDRALFSSNGFCFAQNFGGYTAGQESGDGAGRKKEGAT